MLITPQAAPIATTSAAAPAGAAESGSAPGACGSTRFLDGMRSGQTPDVAATPAAAPTDVPGVQSPPRVDPSAAAFGVKTSQPSPTQLVSRVLTSRLDPRSWAAARKDYVSRAGVDDTVKVLDQMVAERGRFSQHVNSFVDLFSDPKASMGEKTAAIRKLAAEFDDPAASMSALQMIVQQQMMQLELQTKIVEHGTSGVKTVIQTQV